MKCKVSDCFNCPYPDCINDYIEPTRQLSDQQKQHIKQHRKAIYHHRKEAGLCVYCGKRPPEQGRVRCSRCLQKDIKQHEKSSEKRGHTPRCLLDGVNLCKRCGKAKPVEGYKLCERCLESLERARQALFSRTYKQKSFYKEAIERDIKLAQAKKAHKEKEVNNGQG